MEYKKAVPCNFIEDYIYCFWQVKSSNSEERVVTVLPDGYFDVLFSARDDQPFKPLLVGLSTEPKQYLIPKNAITFAISFKLLASEYILKTSIASLVNSDKLLDSNFWNFHASDFATLRVSLKKHLERLVYEYLATLT